MKRRRFLKLSAIASLTPLMYSKGFYLPQSNFSNGPCDDIEDRVFVIIQLSGGNDGINTIIPINQFDDYVSLRPNIHIPETGSNTFIPLDSTLALEDQVGIHPKCVELKELYENGEMAVLQGVSYPSQNRSHFKSNDIMFTGGDGTTSGSSNDSGWFARYLEETYEEQANGTNPNTTPLAVQIGSKKTSLGFHSSDGNHVSVNLTNQDISGYYSVLSEIGTAPIQNIPTGEHGDMLSFIEGVQQDASFYSQGISNAFDSGSNAIEYPDYDLADQLKTVAKLISGGAKTKLYLLKLGGFDTHNEQVVDGDVSNGSHGELLEELSKSVSAFINDLKAQSLDHKVIASTFSEFGRKVKENGNFGTDHGGIAPVFIFGTPVNPGVYGTNVTLTEATEENNWQLTSMQHDYRQVYTTILQDWLGAGVATCDHVFYDHENLTGFSSQKVESLIDANFIVDPSCYDTISSGKFTEGSQEVSISPNPAVNNTTLSFSSSFSGTVSINSMEGKKVYEENGINNVKSINLNLSSLNSGHYIIQLQGTISDSFKLTKVN